MLRFLGVALFIVMLALAWRIGSLLSSDAIGMAVGMTLGVLAGVPTAALVLLARRRDEEDDEHWRMFADRIREDPPNPRHPRSISRLIATRDERLLEVIRSNSCNS